jgi:membrane associated rhomboid family serine protease
MSLYNYGLVPTQVMQGNRFYTIVTNVFLHGGWSHLFGNMFFLLIFGDNVEDACGHLKYLLFYLTCGIAASTLWLATAWGSPYPAVGASGAISGVMGAYFIMFPEARVRTLVGIGLFIRVVRIPAYIMIGLWFIYQFMLALYPLNTGVAYWAHVGGFVAGLAISKIFKPRERRIPQVSYDWRS